MKKLTSNDIRKMWLSFFKSKNHAVVEGASLIPVNDKTLLWINSGVAALKQYFDGSKVSADKRLTNVQKSIRTNDIENVGKTNRHHTFFEMLGNFSIGDYFRTEAITWGFEFLTSKDYLALPLEKLYFTYHPSDTETRDLWISLGVPKSHVIANEDNYWEIGEGPCGPNTEIFFDLGEKIDARGPELLASDIDNDRFLEIWNIVFSQYNAKAGVKRENYEELPSKNIDTGAGLERIASVLQEVPSNFETDLFMPIIKELEKLSGVKYSDDIVSFRVIADHIRTSTFAIADGASFSNEGRGYVLRRVLRRAVRYGQKLAMKEPFLYKLVQSVVDVMKDFYPYLESKIDHVEKLIKAEEVRFLNTLNHGEELLRGALSNSKNISGEVAFKLYDTFGFPIDLTLEIASENGASVDVKGFEVLLEEQRERARAARKNLNSMASQSEDLLKFDQKSKFEEQKFSVTATVIGLFKDGVKVNESAEDVSAIFDVTPFYSESGGQVSDSGFVSNKELRAVVSAMSKAPHGQHLHHLTLDYGVIKVGDKVQLEIDGVARRSIMLNHSATHLLHRALNDVLGSEVSQAGSYVGPDYLRFDFNYNTRVTDEELEKIELIVNKYISDSVPLTVKYMTLAEAQKLGAKALFMEKYGDLVRVVTFAGISVELCGGTHIDNTSKIGTFVIVSESSIASGVRRIVALTGLAAYEHLKTYSDTVKRISKELGLNDKKDVVPHVRTLVEKNALLNSEVIALKTQELHRIASALTPKKHGDTNIYLEYFTTSNREDLGVIADKVRSTDECALLVLVGNNTNDFPLLISVSKELSKSLNANKVMRALTSAFGGRGGGRPDFANGVLLNLPEKAKALATILKVLDE